MNNYLKLDSPQFFEVYYQEVVAPFEKYKKTKPYKQGLAKKSESDIWQAELGLLTLLFLVRHFYVVVPGMDRAGWLMNFYNGHQVSNVKKAASHARQLINSL